MAPARLRHAHYGPRDRYSDPPGAGLCLSAFAILRRGGKVLVGHPADHPRWKREWLPSWRHLGKAELEDVRAEWRIPGAYLLEGEHPEAAVERVLSDQLGVTRASAAGPIVHSAYEKSAWYPGKKHWDLAFVYEVRATRPAKLPPWWDALEWKDPKTLKAEEFGWAADLAEAFGLATP